MLRRLTSSRLFAVTSRLFCEQVDISQTLSKLVKSDKVVVFMKGVPDQPKCGFSNLVVEIMKMHKVPFTAVDVLNDTNVREGIKKFSDWPTIPQVYIDGKFVGGADILLQMHRTGDLIDTLERAGIKSSLIE